VIATKPQKNNFMTNEAAQSKQKQKSLKILEKCTKQKKEEITEFAMTQRVKRTTPVFF